MGGNQFKSKLKSFLFTLCLVPDVPLSSGCSWLGQLWPNPAADRHRLVVADMLLVQPAPSNHKSFFVSACCGELAWTPLMLTGQHPIIDDTYASIILLLSSCIPTTYVNYAKRLSPHHSWKKGSPTQCSFSRFQPSFFLPSWGLWLGAKGVS